MKFKFNKRAVKYGSISIVFIIFFVIAVILVNVLGTFMTDRFSLKIDLTSSGEYSLDEQTTAMLSDISEDVVIYILSTEASMKKSDISTRVLEAIQRYVTFSGGRVSYKFVDPNKNPQFFVDHPKAQKAEAKALVVESPLRYLVVKSSEFAWYANEAKTRVSYGIEEKLSSAILYVTSADVARAAIITGHDEVEPDSLATIFDGNNFERVSLNLSKMAVPDGINNLVISAPASDFTAQEIERLDEYMSRAGASLYVFWNINTPTLPLLERYLTEWGFSMPAYFVCDPDGYQSQAIAIPSLEENDVTAEMTQGQSLILAPRARPINLLWNEKSYMRTLPILSTSKATYAKHLAQNIESLAYAAGDEKGPFVIGAVSERADTENISRIFVFGSSDIANSEISNISIAYNNSLLRGIIDYANPSTNTMDIAPKTVVDNDLNITQKQARNILVIIIAIPILLLALGLVIFFKRRYK